jgi:hypothetical protein
MQRLLDVETDQLPVLWDCDFLLGPKRDSGEDTYVLCEINVSSVSPFPDSALTRVAQATLSTGASVETRMRPVVRPQKGQVVAPARGGEFAIRKRGRPL